MFSPADLVQLFPRIRVSIDRAASQSGTSPGSAELTRQEVRKRFELQLAAHSLVRAASIGKAVTQSIVFEYGPHPGMIRHVNIPTLVMAGKSALQVVGDFAAARDASAPTWDDLLLDTAQPWQLDLACDIEAAWPADAAP